MEPCALWFLSSQSYSQRLPYVERIWMDYTIFVAGFLHRIHHLLAFFTRLALDTYRVHRASRLCFADEATRLLILQRIL
jgi:hypothetical protein